MSTSDDKYTFHKVNVINGEDVYRIHDIDKNCSIYFLNNKKYKYVYVNGKHLLSINGIIDKNIVQFLEKERTYAAMAKKNIFRLNFKDCKPPLDLKAAKEVVEHLNKILHGPCPSLNLSIDYLYNMNGKVVSYNTTVNMIILCLSNHKGCISSIGIEIENGVIIINSNTDSKYAGKKYNKLLRGFMIFIAQSLNCNIIESTAMNPISVWLLLKYYNGTIPHNHNNKYFHDFRNDRPLTRELLKEYEVSLEDPRILRVFEIAVIIDVNDPKTIEKTNETISEVLNKEIRC